MFATAPARLSDRIPEAGFPLASRLIAAASLATILVGGLGVWSVTARIDSAIIGAGSVLVRSDIQNVQHLDGGTLEALLVEEGQRVTAGQPVLVLDTFDLDSQIDMLSAQLTEAEARAARLAAERDGTDMILPEAVLSDDLQARNSFAGEYRLLEENRLKHDADLMALRLRRDQLRFEQEGLRFQLVALNEELGLVRESFVRFSKLLEDGAVERVRVDEVQREMSRLQGEVGSVRANLARSEAHQTEIALEIEQLGAVAKAEAHRDLRSLEPQIMELRQKLEATRARRERAILRAPTAGVVNEVNVATIGEVIPPGKTLLAIVPEASELVIDFRIATTDIDAIQPGQKARLRFASFNQRLTPEIDGIVESIGAAALTDPTTGMSYYSARARAVGDLSELGGRSLVHGMPVEVYVPTAERVVLSYLVQPILDQMNRAMREE